MACRESGAPLQVNKTAHMCKSALEKIDAKNEEARKRKGCGEGSSQDRTRTSITASLRKKLKDLMSEFQELRTKLQQEYREVVERVRRGPGSGGGRGLCACMLRSPRQEGSLRDLPVPLQRYYTVTGQKISEEELDNMIESGESETIFQKAILDQGMAGSAPAASHALAAWATTPRR